MNESSSLLLIKNTDFSSSSLIFPSSSSNSSSSSSSSNNNLNHLTEEELEEAIINKNNENYFSNRFKASRLVNKNEQQQNASKLNLIEKPIMTSNNNTKIIATKVETLSPDSDGDDDLEDENKMDQDKDFLNDQDLTKLDDSINDDVNLDETNGLFLKRKLNDMDLELKTNKITTNNNSNVKIQKILPSPSSTITTGLNDHFTMLISNKQKFENNLSSCDQLLIDSISENCIQFLKITQTEILEKKSIYSLIHPNDHGKFLNIFNLLNSFKSNNETTNNNDLLIESFKSKYFTCQMFVNNNSNQSVDQNSSKPTNMLNNTTTKSPRVLEKMLFIPLNCSLNEKNQSIEFAIKLNNKQQQLHPNNLKLTKQQQQQSSNLTVFPSSLSNATTYDCNMDSFKTNMTRKGLVLNVETNNLRNSITLLNCANNNNNKTTNNGLLCDIKNGNKHVNILDYVHSNDQNHINQHISNVCTKGDNTSAIYRLKVSEKYAFVQTHSRLVANIDHNNNLLSFSNNNNNNTDLGENDKQIICSTHSIIKEIDTEVEMKGNASTSLMKTLIGKKPSSKLATENSAIILNKSIKFKSQFSKEDIASSPLKTDSSPTPIGTKFALTMLGLNVNNNNNSPSLSASSSTDLIYQKDSNEFEDLNDFKSDDTINNNLNETKKLITTEPASSILATTTDYTDSISPVTSSFGRTISLNENLKEENDQLNIKKQKLYDTSNNTAGRKNNVLLKKLLSTNNRQDKSPVSCLFNSLTSSAMNNNKNNRSQSPILSMTEQTVDLQSTDLDLSPILGDEIENESIHSSSPMGLEKEKELKQILFSSLSNNNDKQQSNNSNNQFKSSSLSSMTSKDDIILRTLLNTADLEPQVLKLESVFDLNSTTTTNNNNNKIKKELIESQNQPPLPVIGLSKSISTPPPTTSKKVSSYSNLASDQFSLQITANDKTRKRKKIIKQPTVTDFESGTIKNHSIGQMGITTTAAKATSKKLTAKNNKLNLEYEYQQQQQHQQQLLFNNSNEKKQNVSAVNLKKQTSKSLLSKTNSKTNNNNFNLKQILIGDEEDQEIKKLNNNNNNCDNLIQHFKVEQRSLSPTTIISNANSMQPQQQQQQHLLQNQQHSYHHYQNPINQQQQQPQTIHYLNSDTNSNIKMNNIKEEKIFSSSSLSSSTTSVSSISSLSSPVNTHNTSTTTTTTNNNNNNMNLNTMNHNSNLMNTLVIGSNGNEMTINNNLQHNNLNSITTNDNMPHQDYYMNNQQQHVFLNLNLTNDLLDDFHLTSKSNENDDNSKYMTTSSNMDDQFYMETNNNNSATNQRANFSQLNCVTNNEENDDEMLNQLEQVFSIQSSNLNDIDGDLDSTTNNNNNNFNSNNILTASSTINNNTNITNNNIISNESNLFLNSASSNTINNNSLINKKNSTITNISSNKMPTTNSKVTTQSSDNVQHKTTNSLKDDDITAQKRIEAISYKLKSEFEMYKSLTQSPKTGGKNININNNNTLNNSCSTNSNIMNEAFYNFSNNDPSQSYPPNFVNNNNNNNFRIQTHYSSQSKNIYNSNNTVQNLDEPNLTIDPINTFSFQQNSNQHLNQHMHLPAKNTIATNNNNKSNRRMSLVGSTVVPPNLIQTNNNNQMQLMNDDQNKLLATDSDIQKRQNCNAFNSSNTNPNTDTAQTKKKLYDFLNRNAANSHSSSSSSSSSQMPNSMPTTITSTTTTSSSVTLVPQTTVRPNYQQAPSSESTSNTTNLLVSPNNTNSVQTTLNIPPAQPPPPPVYNSNPNNNNNNNSQLMSVTASRKMSINNENIFFQTTQFNKQNTTTAYNNQSPIMPASVSLQKQISVVPISSGMSPLQPSLSPSTIIQQPQPPPTPSITITQQQQYIQHLHPNQTNVSSQMNFINYNNNNSTNNPSQQTFPGSSNNGSSFINDNSQSNNFLANTAIEQQQYQMFNNNSEDINYYSSSGIVNNDNEIIMDDPMNINSKKQPTADFVKKQLGNTVNKRIHQSKSQTETYHNNNNSEMYLPGSPVTASNQMSNLTINTNMVYSNQQQQKQIMSPPLLMLNGQTTSSPVDQMNLMNNNYMNNNMPISPQSNNNYMKHQQQPFNNSQQSYQNQVPYEYSQTNNNNNQYGKYRADLMRQPTQHDRFTVVDSNNNYLQSTTTTTTTTTASLNDEYDLNFINSNESTPILEEIVDSQQQQQQKLVQQGIDLNNYQYSNQSSINKMNTKQNFTFYRQQQQQQQQQQFHNNNYSNYSTNQQQTYSNQQIRIEQSSNIYQQHPNPLPPPPSSSSQQTSIPSQPIVNYTNTNLINNNELNLISNESGSNLFQLLLD